MTDEPTILELGRQAKTASRALLHVNARKKNSILESMADTLEARGEDILAANARDCERAEANGLAIDDLRLTPQSLSRMVRSVRDVAALRNPVGEDISRWIRPNGLEIVKQRVPIGVIALIYESRPYVTAGSAALCVKTGNAVILRGGQAACESNAAIVDAMVAGGIDKGLPVHAVQLVRVPGHEAVRELLQLQGLVDLAIPRGGLDLMRVVDDAARVPVIRNSTGVCHVFVDASADLDMASAIVMNAKCDRPGLSNAAETLLVHSHVAEAFLPRMVAALTEAGVECRGDTAARRMVPELVPASNEDWTTEYRGMVLSICVIPSLQAAIDHINTHGTHHSDVVVTSSEKAQKTFLSDVDSAAVYINASTRFTEGNEFGMGAEVGVSTDKLHARGPMGLEDLTTYKYLVKGTGQIRE